MQIFWLTFCFLFTFDYSLAVLAKIFQKILNDVFRLEECFLEIILVSDELNWVVLEGSDVRLSHVQNGNNSVEHDVLNEWLKLFHSVLLLCAIGQEFNAET